MDTVPFVAKVRVDVVAGDEDDLQALIIFIPFVAINVDIYVRLEAVHPTRFVILNFFDRIV